MRTKEQTVDTRIWVGVGIGIGIEIVVNPQRPIPIPIPIPTPKFARLLLLFSEQSIMRHGAPDDARKYGAVSTQIWSAGVSPALHLLTPCWPMCRRTQPACCKRQTDTEDSPCGKVSVYGAMRKESIVTFGILIVILGLTLWAYWSVRDNPFNFDDALFLQNPEVTTAATPWHLLKLTQSRQLTYLCFYWNYRLCGASPAGYHLVNLLIHCLNVLAVLMLMQLLFRLAPEATAPGIRRWLPLASAGIFALHPVQSEPVNYIYQRSTLLAALFSLLSLLFFLYSLKARRRWAPLAMAVVSLIAACLSKESALVLPLVMISLLWAHPELPSGSRDKQLRWFLIVLLVLVPAAAGFILYRLHLAGERTVGFALAEESARYLFSQVQVFAAYLRLLLWPSNLAADHDFRVAPLLSLYALSCWMLVISLIGLLFFLRRIAPTAAFLGAAFLLFLAPSSSLIPSADLMFEHRLYLPMIAGSALLAWLPFPAIRLAIKNVSLQRSVWLIIVAALLTAYAAASKHRTSVWGDNIRLWSDTIAKAPGNSRAHYNLGVASLAVDRRAARLEFMKTIQLKPDHAAAHYNLGWLDQIDGHFDSARQHYLDAVRADPNQWQAHQNLGNLAALKGDLEEAIREYDCTIRLRPDQWQAQLSLSTIQMRKGEFETALQTLQRLTERQPGLLEARYLRAYALVEVNRLAEAAEEIRFVRLHDAEGRYRQRIQDLQGYMDSLPGAHTPGVKP